VKVASIAAFTSGEAAARSAMLMTVFTASPKRGSA
jgi:hypothetical protein